MTLVPQWKNVSLGKLKPAQHNPANRISKDRLKPLIQSIQEIGLMYPILIDEDYNIIEGHRRFFAHKKMGMETIACIICKGDKDKIYASLGGVSQKMTQNDLLGVWLKNPNAVPSRSRSTIERAESVVGKDVLKRLYKEKMSAHTVIFAKKILTYCGQDPQNSDLVIEVVTWLLDNTMVGFAQKAMFMAIAPKEMWRAINTNRGLKFAAQVR